MTFDSASTDTETQAHMPAYEPAPPAAFAMTATYSAQDNKVRLSPVNPDTRLDAATYARVRAACFAWAPLQKVFVAAAWSPAAEDVALELAGDIEDEETPLAERAAVRAARFEGYSDKRDAEAERAAAHVERIAGPITGQPVVVGRNSARRAEKEADKIKAAMAAAVKLKETATYWEERAKRVMQHAAYRADPGLRARRIKTLEADERRWKRALTEQETSAKLWAVVARIEDPEEQRKKALVLANLPGFGGLWGDIKDGKIEPADACVRAIGRAETGGETAKRWLTHLTNRLAYERVLLGRKPDEATPKAKRPAQPPLLNYRALDGIQGKDRYNSRNSAPELHRQVEMTAQEYARVRDEYRFTGLAHDGTHRFRAAILHGPGTSPFRGDLVAVFITDTKVHPRPEPKPAAPPEPVEEELEQEEPTPADDDEGLDETPHGCDQETEAPAVEPAPINPFEAMRRALKVGVTAVAVPELFVTPAPLAERVVDEADIQPGDRVLEPSAGLAALAKAARARGGDVVCVDVAPAMTSALRREGFTTHEGDFLAMTPAVLGTFGKVVANPPFSDDIGHVLHAWTFLQPGGRLVAVMSAGVEFRSGRKALAFRAFVKEHGTMGRLPSGSFQASGTGVETVLVVLDK